MSITIYFIILYNINLFAVYSNTELKCGKPYYVLFETFTIYQFGLLNTVLRKNSERQLITI